MSVNAKMSEIGLEHRGYYDFDAAFELDQEKPPSQASKTLCQGSGGPSSTSHLRRDLKDRHISMISIGSAVGTGLFIGTANSLREGGPIGLVLGYILTGTAVWAVMVALGEMIAQLPIAGGHVALAHRFVDPSLSFAIGWACYCCWSLALPVELSAASILVHFWTDQVHNAVWITIALLFVGLINFAGAGVFGEAEFIFSSFKVICIVFLLLLGIVLDLGGGPHGDVIGFRNWASPGPFVQHKGIPGAAGRFFGFFSVLIQATFSYLGTEMTAIAAGEASNPRRNLPRAIRKVMARMLLFYVMGTIVISLLVPSNEPRLNLAESTGAKSPFVIAIQNAGIKGLPSVINAAIISAAWSAGSSDIYISTRALYGLALTGSAPRCFTKTTSWGLPLYPYLMSLCFGCLAYMSTSEGRAGKVFIWVSTLGSASGLLGWAGICITYLRFYHGCNVQGVDRKAVFPYTAPLQPYLTWYGLVYCCLVTVFSGFGVFFNGYWNTATFVTTYLPLIVVLALYTGHKSWFRVPWVQARDMDFFANSWGADEVEEPQPRNFFQKVWRFIW